MNKDTRQISFIMDSIVLVVMGLFSVCYAVFPTNFAELHISLPFLDFPIFIGEILLFLCFILLVIKWRNNPKKAGIPHYLLGIYFLYVLIKAIYGCYIWGPLAYRHAALYYYPLFAIFGYTFYNRAFFDKKVLFLSLMFIAGLFYFFPGRLGYFLLTYFILAIVVIKAYPGKVLRYILLFLLIVLTPYRLFFASSRTGFVSNIAALMFVIAALFFMSKMRRVYKMRLFATVIILMLVGALKLSNPTARTLVGLKGLREIYNKFNADIIFQKDTFKMIEYKHPKLYNPELKPERHEPRDAQTAIARYELQAEELQAKEKQKELTLEEIAAKSRGTQHKIRYLQAKVEELQLAKEKIQPEVETKPVQAGFTTRLAIKDVVDTAKKALIDADIWIRDPKIRIERNSNIWTVRFSPREANASMNVISVVLKETEGIEAELIVEDLITETGKIKPTKLTRKQPELPRIQLAKDAEIETVEQPRIQLAKITELEIERTQAKIQEAEAQMEELWHKQKKMQDIVERAKKETKGVRNKLKAVTYIAGGAYDKLLGPSHSNTLFRLFIWRDMLVQFWEEKPFLFGFDFGKPLRSRSIEMAQLGEGEWRQDWGGTGWITAHNSFLHIFYRTSIAGIVFIGTLLFLLVKMIRQSIKLKLINGILLCGALIYWLVAANFLVILELPRHAIPFWSLFGVTFAYMRSLQVK